MITINAINNTNTKNNNVNIITLPFIKVLVKITAKLMRGGKSLISRSINVYTNKYNCSSCREQHHTQCCMSSRYTFPKYAQGHKGTS